MSKPTDAAVQIQRRYYTETAASYDTMHAQESVDSPYCLALVSAVLRALEIQSLLDVGSATGRGLRAFAATLPGTLVCGVAPVAALVQQGVDCGRSQPLFPARLSAVSTP